MRSSRVQSRPNERSIKARYEPVTFAALFLTTEEKPPNLLLNSATNHRQIRDVYVRPAPCTRQMIQSGPLGSADHRNVSMSVGAIPLPHLNSTNNTVHERTVDWKRCRNGHSVQFVCSRLMDGVQGQKRASVQEYRWCDSTYRWSFEVGCLERHPVTFRSVKEWKFDWKWIYEGGPISTYPTKEKRKFWKVAIYYSTQSPFSSIYLTKRCSNFFNPSENHAF